MRLHISHDGHLNAPPYPSYDNRALAFGYPLNCCPLAPQRALAFNNEDALAAVLNHVMSTVEGDFRLYRECQPAAIEHCTGSLSSVLSSRSHCGERCRRLP